MWAVEKVPLFNPVWSKTKPIATLSQVFFSLRISYTHLLGFWLVHCIVFPLWWARVIKLVLVLWLLIENCPLISYTYCY